MGASVSSVVMTVDTIGGIWTYALDLGRELTKRGVSVVFAVLGPGANEAKLKVALDAGIEVVDLDAPPEWLADKPVAVARGAEALVQLARDMGVDLIHLNHPALAADVRFGRPVLAVCHSCVATWWQAVKNEPLPEAMRWQADLIGRGYAAATALVAPTTAFAAATAAAYGLGQQPAVVHNGRRIVEADGAGEPIRGVLIAGRLWDEGKNVAVLDAAAALSKVPFRAAGPLSFGTNVVELRNMTALGAVPGPTMRYLLDERPIFASAALYEPFGLSILEAAQSGCALVLSDIPTLRELWDGAALFAPAQDPAAFARAVDQLADDPALRASQADAARRRARAYSLDACVVQTIGLYETAVAAAGAATA